MFWPLRWSRRAWRWSLLLLTLAAWLLAGVAFLGYLTRAPRHTIPLHFRTGERIFYFWPCRGLAFITDDESGQWDVWDAQSGARRSELEDLSGTIRQVAFAPTDKTVFLVGNNVEVWDTAKGRRLIAFPTSPPNFEAKDVACSPDGRILAVVEHRPGNDDADYVALCDATTGKERARIACPGAYQALFFPDGNTLAVEFPRDGTMVLYDLITLRRRSELRVWPTHRFSFPISLFAFSPDCRVLAFVTGDKIYLFDTQNGNSLGTYGGVITNGVMFSPDSKTVAVNYYEQNSNGDAVARWVGEQWAERLFPDRRGTVLIDSCTGTPKYRLPGQHPLAFRPDGTLVTAPLSGQSDILQVWDIPPARAVQPVWVGAAFLLAVCLSAAWWRWGRRA